MIVSTVKTSVSVGAHALAIAPCLLHDVDDHHAGIAEHRRRAARVAVSPRIQPLAVHANCCRRDFENNNKWNGRVVWGVSAACIF